MAGEMDGDQERRPGGPPRVEIKVGSAKDVPVLAANKVIVNFTGSEFLVTVLAAYPDPFFRLDRRELPESIEGRVLGRYAFSVAEWVPAVKSFEDMIRRMEAKGTLQGDVGEEDL